MKKNYDVGVVATGMHLPRQQYSNDDVIQSIMQARDNAGLPPKELNAQWIADNIGIEGRYYFGEDEHLDAVSVLAVQQALATAGWSALDLDFVILASVSLFTEDDSTAIPSVACQIQEQLGAYNAFAYDSLAACSGFLYGMAQGVSFIEGGMCERGVVICAERQRIGLNYADHRSSILIGDVATATLLAKTDTPKVRTMKLCANDDKHLSDIINLHYHRFDDAGVRHKGHFSLQGKAVFKEGVRTMTRLTIEALAANQLSVDDVDWFIYHQANAAMLRMVADKVGIPSAKNLMNIDQLANTTGATIPSVLHMFIENGTIERGDTICCVGFGGGITSGSIVFEY